MESYSLFHLDWGCKFSLSQAEAPCISQLGLRINEGTLLQGPEGTEVKEEGDFGLANVAATVVKLLGFEVPEQWLEPIIK